jgi:hypothetical protein
MCARRRLLRSGGRFVFSVLHPCFNNPHIVHMGEMEERNGAFVTGYAVKIRGYLSPTVTPGTRCLGNRFRCGRVEYGAEWFSAPAPNTALEWTPHSVGFLSVRGPLACAPLLGLSVDMTSNVKRGSQLF